MSHEQALRELLREAGGEFFPAASLERLERRVRRQQRRRALGAGMVAAGATALVGLGTALSRQVGGAGLVHPEASGVPHAGSSDGTWGALSPMAVNLSLVAAALVVVVVIIWSGLASDRPGHRVLAFGAAQGSLGVVATMSTAPIATTSQNTAFMTAWLVFLVVVVLRERLAPHAGPWQGVWGLGPGLLGTGVGAQLGLGSALYVVSIPSDRSVSALLTGPATDSAAFGVLLAALAVVMGSHFVRHGRLPVVSAVQLRRVVSPLAMSYAAFFGPAFSVTFVDTGPGLPPGSGTRAGVVVVMLALVAVAVWLRPMLQPALVDLAPGLSVAAAILGALWADARGVSDTRLVLLAIALVVVAPMVLVIAACWTRRAEFVRARQGAVQARAT